MFPLIIGIVFVALVVIALFAVMRSRTSPTQAKSYPANLPVLDTGLKAIDLLAPLPRSGDVLISGDPGAGAKTIAGEMMYRLQNHPSLPYQTLCLLDAGSKDAEVMSAEFSETLPDSIQRRMVQSIATRDVMDLVQQSSRESRCAIVVFSQDERFIHLFRDAIREMRTEIPASSRLLAIIVTESMHWTTCDATVYFSQSVAESGVYPALDPQRSSSRLSDDPRVPAHRREIAARLRRLLADVVESLYPDALGDPQWMFNQRGANKAQGQAFRFLSQLLFTAEPYTGKKAACIAADDAAIWFRQILDGQFEQLPPQSFLYQNKLPH
ncbi:hypothetical protein [Stieleria varia]|uniref:ATP synthase subunit beta n=1 Tax=Stieleria varia TaxID=2528005 RepID=A0A5C5ZVW5_9BACT|nr:hypothetical protein [Stieleria varia]TWT91157.1 ATP synthase subunit beta [Stieleria varia]